MKVTVTRRARSPILAALIAAFAFLNLGMGPAVGADQNIKPEDIPVLFKKTDKNGDGAVTKEELNAVDPKLAVRFELADANQDGKLTSKEFWGLFS